MRIFARIWLASFVLSCGGDSKEDAPVAVAPSRYVVSFDDSIDMAVYRAAKEAGPAPMAKVVAQMRGAIKERRAEVAAKIKALGGEVVEYWWMSGDLTVVVPADKVAALQRLPGVKRVRPEDVYVP